MSPVAIPVAEAAFPYASLAQSDATWPERPSFDDLRRVGRARFSSVIVAAVRQPFASCRLQSLSRRMCLCTLSVQDKCALGWMEPDDGVGDDDAAEKRLEGYISWRMLKDTWEKHATPKGHGEHFGNGIGVCPTSKLTR